MNKRIDQELERIGNVSGAPDYTQRREEIIAEMKKGVAKNFPR